MCSIVCSLYLRHVGVCRLSLSDTVSVVVLYISADIVSMPFVVNELRSTSSQVNELRARDHAANELLGQ